MWKAAFGSRSDRTDAASSASTRRKKSKTSDSVADGPRSSVSRRDDRDRSARSETARSSVGEKSDRRSSKPFDSSAALTAGALRKLDDQDEWEDDSNLKRQPSTRGEEGRSRRRRDTKSEKSRSRSRERQTEKKRRQTRDDASGEVVSRGVEQVSERGLQRSRTLPLEGVTGLPLSQSPPLMSGGLVDDRPPLQHSASLPVQASRADSYGAASEYYLDEGQSVHTQPGVRVSTPNMLYNPDTHLMAASAEPHPVADTGTGSAADFYNGKVSPVAFEPRPSKISNPEPQPSVMPGLATAAAVATAGAFVAHESMAGGSSSYHTNNVPSGGGPGNGSSTFYGQTASSDAYNYAQNGATSTSGPGFQGSLGTPLQNFNGATQTVQYHDAQSTAIVDDTFQSPVTRLKEGLLNLISSPEDIRKMEEYTEYIGVCKYCFDPRSSPGNAPRQHHYHRRPAGYGGLRKRDSNGRIRPYASDESLRRRAGMRVDKDTRYSVGERGKQRMSSEADMIAAGAATAGLAAAALASTNSSSKSRKDFDDTYSVKTGTRYSTSSRRRSRSSSRERRRRSSFESRPTQQGTHWATVRTRDGRVERRRVYDAPGSAPHGRDGAGVEPREPSNGRRESHDRTQFVRKEETNSQRSTRRTRTSSNHRSRRSSSSSASPSRGRGIFGMVFSPRRSSRKSKREHGQRSKKEKSSFFNFANNSASSSDTGLAFGEPQSSRSNLSLRRKPSRRISDHDIAATVAGIGATAAALAAAQRQRKNGKRRQEYPDLRSSRRDEGRRDGRIARRTAEEEDEWVDELPSDVDDRSNASESGLAFGDVTQFHSGGEESDSSRSGLAAWGWRWGNKPIRSSRQRRDTETPGESGPGLPYAPSNGVAPITAMKPTSNATAVSQADRPTPPASGRPLEFVDPRPIAEDTLMQNAGIGRRAPSIQQPQPIAPVQASFVRERPDFDDGRDKRQRETPSTNHRESQGGMSFAEGAALVAAGVLATQAASSGRDSFSVSPRNTQDTRSSEQVEAVKREARRAAKVADAEEREKRVRRQREAEIRQQAEATVRETKPLNEVKNELADVKPNRDQAVSAGTKTESPTSQYTTNRREPEQQSEKKVTYAAKEILPDDRSSGIPVMDDHILDKDFFKRKRAESAATRELRQAEIARKAADKVIADMDEYYAQPTPSQGDFFAPKDILSESTTDTKTQVSGPDADLEVRVAEDLDHDHRYKLLNGPSDKSRYAPYGVPSLKVISPTPPPGEKPTVQARAPSPLSEVRNVEPEPAEDSTPKRDRSRTISWGEDKTHIFEAQTPDSFEERDSYMDARSSTEPASVPTDGDVKTPESPKRRDEDLDNVSAKDLADRSHRRSDDKREEGREAAYVTPDVAYTTVTYQPSQTPAQRDYSSSVIEPRVSDEPLESSKYSARDAESSQGKSSEKTTALPEDDDWTSPTSTRKRKKPEKPNGVNGVQRAFIADTTSEPASDRNDFPPEVPLSKKEQKKRDKAAKRESVTEKEAYDNFDDVDSRPIATATQDHEPPWEPPLSKKDQKKRDKAAKRESVLEEKSRETFATGQPDSIANINAEEEPAWEPPLSKKEQKKREKAAERESVVVEEESREALPGDEPDALSSNTTRDEAAWEPPLSKKEQKKREKAAKRESAFEEESREAIQDVETDTLADTASREEPAWEPPLSKKEQKKRDKASKRESVFEEESRDTSADVDSNRFTDTNLVDEPAWEPPLSKKELKKREKAAKRETPSEEESRETQVDAYPTVSADPPPADEPAWEPPLSKKEQKKRDKAAKRQSTLDEDFPETSAAADTNAMSNTADMDEPAWEPPLSKKEQKKREKAAKREAEIEQEFQANEASDSVPNSEMDERTWEPPLSKKEQKKRDKAAKRLSSKGTESDSLETELSRQSVANDTDAVSSEQQSSSKFTKATDSPTVDAAVLSLGAAAGVAALASAEAEWSDASKSGDHERSKSEVSRMPGSWDEPTESDVVDPFQYQIRDDAVDMADKEQNERSNNTPKRHRDSARFSEPTVSSPLRSEWTFEDYIEQEAKHGFDPSILEDNEGTGSAVSPSRVKGDGDRSNNKRAASVDATVTSRGKERTTSRRSRPLSGSDYYAEAITAEPLDLETEVQDDYESARRPKRYSKHDDDDTMSVTSSRSRRSRDDPGSAKKEKKSGILSLFRRKSTDSVTSTPTSERNARREKESDDEGDDKRSRRSKDREDPYADQDNEKSSSTSANKSRSRKSRRSDSQPEYDDKEDQRSLRSQNGRGIDDEIDDDDPGEGTPSQRGHKEKFDNDTKDQSFLGVRVENLPSLPDDSNKLSSSASQVNEQEHGNPVSAEVQLSPRPENDTARSEVDQIQSDEVDLTRNVSDAKGGSLESNFNDTLETKPIGDGGEDETTFLASLPPLPDSPPDSPVAAFRTPQRGILPIKAIIPTSVPLRFPFAPPRPSPKERSASISLSTPTSPATPSSSKKARPSSFEMRPLYLVEINRKIADVDEILPSLPSSKTTSRSSSVHDLDDDASTSGSETYGRRRRMTVDSGATLPWDGEDVEMASGQTTPRANESDVLASSPRGRPEPQFYTWEDFRKDEWLHQQAESSLQDAQRDEGLSTEPEPDDSAQHAFAQATEKSLTMDDHVHSPLDVDVPEAASLSTIPEHEYKDLVEPTPIKTGLRKELLVNEDSEEQNTPVATSYMEKALALEGIAVASHVEDAKHQDTASTSSPLLLEKEQAADEIFEQQPDQTQQSEEKSAPEHDPSEIGLSSADVAENLEHEHPTSHASDHAVDAQSHPSESDADAKVTHSIEPEIQRETNLAEPVFENQEGTATVELNEPSPFLSDPSSSDAREISMSDQPIASSENVQVDTEDNSATAPSIPVSSNRKQSKKSKKKRKTISFNDFPSEPADDTPSSINDVTPGRDELEKVSDPAEPTLETESAAAVVNDEDVTPREQQSDVPVDFESSSQHTLSADRDERQPCLTEDAELELLDEYATENKRVEIADVVGSEGEQRNIVEPERDDSSRVRLSKKDRKKRKSKQVAERDFAIDAFQKEGDPVGNLPGTDERVSDSAAEASEKNVAEPTFEPVRSQIEDTTTTQSLPLTKKQQKKLKKAAKKGSLMVEEPSTYDEAADSTQAKIADPQNYDEARPDEDIERLIEASVVLDDSTVAQENGNVTNDPILPESELPVKDFEVEKDPLEEEIVPRAVSIDNEGTDLEALVLASEIPLPEVHSEEITRGEVDAEEFEAEATRDDVQETALPSAEPSHAVTTEGTPHTAEDRAQSSPVIAVQDVDQVQFAPQIPLPEGPAEEHSQDALVEHGTRSPVVTTEKEIPLAIEVPLPQSSSEEYELLNSDEKHTDSVATAQSNVPAAEQTVLPLDSPIEHESQAELLDSTIAPSARETTQDLDVPQTSLPVQHLPEEELQVSRDEDSLPTSLPDASEQNLSGVESALPEQKRWEDHESSQILATNTKPTTDEGTHLDDSRKRDSSSDNMHLDFTQTLAAALASSGFDPQMAVSKELVEPSTNETMDAEVDSTGFQKIGRNPKKGKKKKNQRKNNADALLESSGSSGIQDIVEPPAGHQTAEEFDDFLRGSLRLSGFDDATIERVISPERMGSNLSDQIEKDSIHQQAEKAADRRLGDEPIAEVSATASEIEGTPAVTKTSLVVPEPDPLAHDGDLSVEEMDKRYSEMRKKARKEKKKNKKRMAGGSNVSPEEDLPPTPPVQSRQDDEVIPHSEDVRVVEESAPDDHVASESEIVSRTPAPMVEEQYIQDRELFEHAEDNSSHDTKMGAMDLSEEPPQPFSMESKLSPTLPSVDHENMSRERSTTIESRENAMFNSIDPEELTAAAALGFDFAREGATIGDREQVSKETTPTETRLKSFGHSASPSTWSFDNIDNDNHRGDKLPTTDLHHDKQTRHESESQHRSLIDDTRRVSQDSVDNGEPFDGVLRVHKVRGPDAADHVVDDRSRTSSNSSAKTSLESTSKNRVSHLFQSPPGIVPGARGSVIAKKSHASSAEDHIPASLETAIMPTAHAPMGKKHSEDATPDQVATMRQETAHDHAWTAHSPSASGHRSLRRSTRSVSGDLRNTSPHRAEGTVRAAAAAGAETPVRAVRTSPPATLLPFGAPPTPPLQDEERDELNFGILAAAGGAAMSDVFAGYGGAERSQVSPTRPPSVRKRQSMHIVDLENRLNQLAEENRALQEAHHAQFPADGHSNWNDVLTAHDAQLREKDAELNRINGMLGPMQEEIARLSEINDGLTEANRNLVDDTNGRYATLQDEHATAHEQWQSTSRDLQQLQGEHERLQSSMRATVEEQIASALSDRNAEILRLREQLDVAHEQIRALQVQIEAQHERDFLTTRDEDYFDGACQKLCQHVQQWVLRFSKLSDNRVCRLSSEMDDDKVEARIDNAMLDGSDADKLLADRVRRRDVFMSVVMTMIWEYVFARYLFGMDREQRQKLKALERILAEVGPPRAVAQWRATTLTLLCKRPEFATQCALDTEAVALEIYTVLYSLLPPPANTEQQLKQSLQKVVGVAVDLHIEMRTQRAEYIMLPPLQPEYDTNGDLLRKVYFNASLMNERSGFFSSNQSLERERATVKIVLFPLVVKKGNELGEGEEEIVVCPAQVLVQNDQGRGKKVVRVMSGAMEIDDPRRSRQSLRSITPGSVAF